MQLGAMATVGAGMRLGGLATTSTMPMTGTILAATVRLSRLPKHLNALSNQRPLPLLMACQGTALGAGAALGTKAVGEATHGATETMQMPGQIRLPLTARRRTHLSSSSPVRTAGHQSPNRLRTMVASTGTAMGLVVTASSTRGLMPGLQVQSLPAIPAEDGTRQNLLVTAVTRTTTTTAGTEPLVDLAPTARLASKPVLGLLTGKTLLTRQPGQATPALGRTPTLLNTPEGKPINGSGVMATPGGGATINFENRPAYGSMGSRRVTSALCVITCMGYALRRHNGSWFQALLAGYH